MKNLVITFLLSMLGIATYAQNNNIEGTWKTANQNTLIKIEKEDGVYAGKIISSDDKEVKPGTQIMRDIKLKRDKWTGKMYAPKRQEWYNIDLNPLGSKLEITVYVGFFSKTIEWTKM